MTLSADVLLADLSSLRAEDGRACAIYTNWNVAGVQSMELEP